MEVNADISTKAPIVLLEASQVAGPLPIDLPKRIIFFGCNVSLVVK